MPAAAGAAGDADDDEGWRTRRGGRGRRRRRRRSDPVAAEALEDLDLEDDDIDEEDPSQHAGPRAPGYRKWLRADGRAAARRVKDLDCDGQRCRIVVPGHDDLC